MDLKYFKFITAILLAICINHNGLAQNAIHAGRIDFIWQTLGQDSTSWNENKYPTKASFYFKPGKTRKDYQFNDKLFSFLYDSLKKEQFILIEEHGEVIAARDINSLFYSIINGLNTLGRAKRLDDEKIVQGFKCVKMSSEIFNNKDSIFSEFWVTDKIIIYTSYQDLSKKSEGVILESSICKSGKCRVMSIAQISNESPSDEVFELPLNCKIKDIQEIVPFLMK